MGKKDFPCWFQLVYNRIRLNCCLEYWDFLVLALVLFGLDCYFLWLSEIWLARNGKWAYHNAWRSGIVCLWIPPTKHFISLSAWWGLGSRGDLSKLMCRGTFGCLIIAVGCVTSAILSSRCLTGSTTVDFAAEFSVAPVLQTRSLPPNLLMTRGQALKRGRKSGCVITVTSNGRKL